MSEISVIVPVYNAQKTVQRCIDSILAQSFCDFELILINDGSPDDSSKICLAAAEKDARIRYFEKPNGGLASARNYGMDAASGGYLCFVDSDDYIDTDCLEFLHKKAHTNNADIVLCGYFMENGGSVSRITTEACLVTGENLNQHIVELKSKNLIDTACNKLYKRDFITESGVRMPVGETFEDTDFNLRLLKHKPVIEVCSECFYHYILHMGSITRHYNPKKLPTIKKRARLLKECAAGVEEYCDYYYIKSVFSSIIDMFLSCKRSEIMNVIRNEIQDGEFRAAALGAKADGRNAKLVIGAARSLRAARIYYFCKASYLLKYRMQRLFLRVRQ